jgi:hypothetical protein
VKFTIIYIKKTRKAFLMMRTVIYGSFPTAQIPMENENKRQ